MRSIDWYLNWPLSIFIFWDMVDLLLLSDGFAPNFFFIFWVNRSLKLINDSDKKIKARLLLFGDMDLKESKINF